MAKLFIMIIALCSCAAFGHGKEKHVKSAGEPQACVATAGEVAYKVTGMHCGGCNDTISNHFKSQAQVAKASADYKSQCLKVTWKEGQSMTDEQVAAELEKTGYALATDGPKKSSP